MEGETKNVSKLLASTLPEEIIKNKINDPEEYLKSFLQQQLPKSDIGDIPQGLKYNFYLDKTDIALLKKKKLKPHRKKQLLTRKQRKEFNLLKLPRDGWNYKQLESLRKLWENYMHDNLDGLGKVPTYSDPEWQAFTVVLGKSELIGAEIQIVKSNVPSLIGQRGTIVLETKCTIQIVSPDDKLKILLKQHLIFSIELDNVRFTIFGKSLCTKPSERSVKKLKTLLHPHL